MCLERAKVCQRLWKGTWGVIWSYEKFSQSIAAEYTTCFLFDYIGPLECRIACLPHCPYCISPHRTGITRHQKHLANNTSQPMFMLDQRQGIKCSTHATVLCWILQSLPCTCWHREVWPWDMCVCVCLELHVHQQWFQASIGYRKEKGRKNKKRERR